MSSKRERRTPAERREQLLDAADALFRERGYEGVHVDDVCRASNLSKGGFYHHFRSKDNLLEALAHREVDRLSTTLKGCSEALSPDRALVEVFRLGSVFVDGEATLFDALGAAREVDATHPVSPALTLYVDAFDRALVARLKPLLERIIAAGIDENVFRSVDAAMTAELVLAVNGHANRKIACGEWSIGAAARYGANALDALGTHLGTAFASSSARTLARTRAASTRR